MSELFGLPDGYEVLLGNGGSTCFWDAAAFGLIERRSAHLVLGEFSSKFAAISTAAPHLDAPDVLESEPGAVPATFDAVDADVYAYPHNETSTGVTVPLHRPAGDALVVVDGTSAAGGTPFAPDRVDVYYFAPQKCFAGDGGLWLACCSPGCDRAHRTHRRDRAVDAAVARPRHRARELPPRPDVQHARAGHVVPARAPDRVDERERRARVDLGAVRGVGRGAVRLGRSATVGDAVRQGPGLPQPGHRHHRLRSAGRRRRDRGDAARQRHRRRRAVPQARPQPTAHRAVPGDRDRRRRDPHARHRPHRRPLGS